LKSGFGTRRDRADDRSARRWTRQRRPRTTGAAGFEPRHHLASLAAVCSESLAVRFSRLAELLAARIRALQAFTHQANGSTFRAGDFFRSARPRGVPGR
jgi:hypothetical protein